MAGFDKSFLQEIKDKVPLVQLVERSVIWDKKKSKPAKGDWWSPCPFHSEKTSSFHVAPQGFYKCFGCGAKGDHFEWLQQHDGLSFGEAVDHLAQLAGVPVPRRAPQDRAQEARANQLYEIMAAADKWFRTRWKAKERGRADEAIEYLQARGVSGATAKAFGLGFAPAGGLRKHLLSLGYDLPSIMDAGLLGKGDNGTFYERFRDRIMFPIHDARGRVVAFGGRALPGHSDKTPKYLNSAASRIYDKSRTLYNLHRARKTQSGGDERLLVVEGYLDVIAVHQSGHGRVVATCGTALTEQHLVEIWRTCAEPVLCFDNDKGGLAAAARVVDVAMPMLRPSQTVQFCTLPAGKDPADLLTGAWYWQSTFWRRTFDAVPLVEFAWSRALASNDLQTPERVARFIQDLADLVARIENGSVRQHYAGWYRNRTRSATGAKVNLAKLAGRRSYSNRGAAPYNRGQAIAGQLAALPSSEPAELVSGGAGVSLPEMLIDHETDLFLAGQHLTDLGNAYRFIKRNGHRFRWCNELGWLAYDGRRWVLDGADHMVQRAVEETILQIAAEGQALIDAGQDEVFKEDGKGNIIMLSDTLTSWCTNSQSGARVQGLSHLAKARLSVKPGDLDRDPFKLCVLNGTLTFGHNQPDFVSFGPHDPDDLITKLAPVTYDPDAACATYDKALEKVQPDLTNRTYLHTVGGLCLTGDATPQQMWFWYGNGSNGKSTIVDIWSRLLGDYAQTIPIETFLETGRSRTGDQATPHLVSLVGARLVRASEPAQGARLSESLIKEVTGGEPMKVRQLNKPFFDFKPQFKLIVSGNYKPEIRGIDEGIWRRVNLVPWKVHITDDADKDPHLVDKVVAGELSGVLNHLLDGLRLYFLEGRLTKSADVAEAVESYRRDADPLGRFIEDCLDRTDDDADRLPAKLLYETYTRWCDGNGEYAWKLTSFGKALRERGLRRRKVSVNMYLGIRFTDAGLEYSTDVGDRQAAGDPGPGDDYDQF
jgi:DNA primase